MSNAATAKVLAVEDDPIVRADLRLVLEDAGFSVCPDARNGIEAVEMARRHRPDLVLIDLGLPLLDGVEATRQIVRERDVPVVVFTAHSDGDFIDRAIDAGAVGYVRKPFETARLVETLTDALDDHERKQGVRALIREGNSRDERIAASKPDRDQDVWDWEYGMPTSYVRWFRMWAGR